jgi:opacity protein-like surface antigen
MDCRALWGILVVAAIFLPIASEAQMLQPTSASENALSPWYIQGSIGGFFNQEVSGPETFFKQNNRQITATGTDRVDFSPGPIGSFAIGYNLMEEIRVETEFDFAFYNLNSIHAFTTNPNFPDLDGSRLTRQSGAQRSRFIGTLNAFYDFPISYGLVPYVGGGLGVAHISGSDGLFSGTNVTDFLETGVSRTTGVGFVEAGISFPVTDQISIVPAYRYMHFFAGGTQAAQIGKIAVRYRF